MIDTDKYEGHTPAPWKASHDVLEYGHIVNNNGWRVYVGEHEKRAVIENRTFMHDDLSEANAQLIADSPLLLAEVKRLHEVINKAMQQHTVLEYRLDLAYEYIMSLCSRGWLYDFQDWLKETDIDEAEVIGRLME